MTCSFHYLFSATLSWHQQHPVMCNQDEHVNTDRYFESSCLDNWICAATCNASARRCMVSIKRRVPIRHQSLAVHENKFNQFEDLLFLAILWSTQLAHAKHERDQENKRKRRALKLHFFLPNALTSGLRDQVLRIIIGPELSPPRRSTTVQVPLLLLWVFRGAR